MLVGTAPLLAARLMGVHTITSFNRCITFCLVYMLRHLPRVLRHILLVLPLVPLPRLLLKVDRFHPSLIGHPRSLSSRLRKGMP